jgi:hypothetical protein
VTATITRSYDTYAGAKQVVRDLKEAGFTDSQISLVAHRHQEDDSIMDGVATGAGVGAAAGGAAGLLAGIGLLAIPGVGPVVAAGWLAAMAAGAAAGGATGAAAGGIIDALVDSGVDRDDAPVYAETLRRGGAVVSVRTDDGRRSLASDIMDRATPVDIASRRHAYTDAGWTSYDPAGQPLSDKDIAAERGRYI